jgi:hypothetical protein
MLNSCIVDEDIELAMPAMAAGPALASQTSKTANSALVILAAALRSVSGSQPATLPRGRMMMMGNDIVVMEDLLHFHFRPPPALLHLRRNALKVATTPKPEHESFVRKSGSPLIVLSGFF